MREFLHLYSSRILAYNFLFCVYLSGFDIRVILALEKGSRSAPSIYRVFVLLY